MEQPIASVIISVYNNFDRLRKVLVGLEMQTRQGFEIILSDDGSTEESVQQMLSYAKDSKIPVQHIWQEDNGFRKTIVLNKSVQAAKSDYLIFLDADCVPHPKFVEEHLHHRKQNRVLSGLRVLLSEKLTNWLTLERIKNGVLSQNRFLAKIFIDSLGETRLPERAIYKPNFPFKNILKPKFKTLYGCNWSIYKKDLLDINGFDERYLAPAVGEDTDPEFRLKFAGKELVSINYQAVQYHLYHKLLPRPQVNEELLKQVKELGKPWTEYGIKQTEEAKAYLKTLSPTK